MEIGEDGGQKKKHFQQIKKPGFWWSERADLEI